MILYVYISPDVTTFERVEEREDDDYGGKYIEVPDETGQQWLDAQEAWSKTEQAVREACR